MSASPPAFRMHDREFVAMMASVMALNALAVDAMLPAFPAIGRSLHVADANSLQYILSSYLLANAVGSLVAGPLADRFGRRPMMLLSIAFAAIGGLASAVTPSFEALLKATAEADFAPVYAALEGLEDLPPDTVLPEDRLFTRGTQAYWRG